MSFPVVESLEQLSSNRGQGSRLVQRLGSPGGKDQYLDLKGQG